MTVKKAFSKQDLLIFLGLLILFLLVYTNIFDSKLFLGGDNANYYILAQGLANGEGYISYSTPGFPPANHFPPGYPFLMSLLIRIGIDTVIAMKVFNGILLYLSSCLFYLIANKISKNVYLSVIVACLLLLNKHILEYSTMMMSEIPFLFFSLLNIYLFILLKANDYKVKSVVYALFIITLVSTIYIRTQGIALIGAYLLTFLLDKQYKTILLTLILVIAALTPWQLRSKSLGGNTYVSQLTRVDPYNANSDQLNASGWISRIGTNTKRYISKEIPNSIFPALDPKYKDPKNGKIIPSPISYWIIGFVIIVLSLLGIWSIKQYRWYFLFLFAGTFAILLLWPNVWFGTRFMLPLIPFIILFMCIGILFILKLVTKIDTAEKPKYALMFIVFAFISISPIKALAEKAEKEHPKNWGNYLTIAEWCDENLPEDAIICTRKPGLFYTYSKRQGIGVLNSTDRKEFLDFLDKYGVTHVVIEQLGFSQTGRCLIPVVQVENQKFTEIKKLGVNTKKDKDGKLLPSTFGVWVFEYNPELGYNGEYKDGRRDGKGVFKAKNGSTYEAHWKQDTLVGQGVYTDAKNNIFEGSWEKGKKEGKFIITNPKGEHIESYWKHDTIMPDGYLLDNDFNRIKQIRLR